MGGAVKSVSSGIKSVGNFGGKSGLNGILGNITGTGNNSGIFGLGQFRTDPYRANMGAFQPDQAENQYIAGLQQAVAGQGPSVAEQQMMRGVDAANAQAQSMAASQRGISPALAARLAAQQQAGMAQNANANAAMMRAQEQMDARNLLGQGLQSIRTGRMAGENLASGNHNFAQGLNLQGYANAAGRRADFMGGLMNGAGGMMSMFGGAGGGMVPDPASFNQTPRIPELAAVNPAYNQGKPKGGPGKKKEWAPNADGGKSGAKTAPRLVSPAMAHGGEVKAASKAGQFLASQPVQQFGFGGIAKGLGSIVGAMGSGFGLGRSMGSAMGRISPQEHVPVTPMPYGIAVKGNQKVPNQPAMLADKNPPPPVQTAQPVRPETPFAHFGMMDKFRTPAGAGMFGKFESGGEVPGEAEVAGDSYANDKVPAMLSPKEIVLPRSVTLSDDAPARAAEFVAAVKARQQAKKKAAS